MVQGRLSRLRFVRGTGILLLGSSLVLGFLLRHRAGIADAFESALYDQGCTPSLNAHFSATTLLSIARAQADYREHDRDGNHRHDFWRGDVAGLYWHPDANGTAIRLIELSVANADDWPLSRFARNSVRSSKSGYWVLTILHEGEETPSPDRFAACAFPDSRSDGKYTFILDEHETVYRKALRNQRGVDFFPMDPTKSGWTRVN